MSGPAIVMYLTRNRFAFTILANGDRRKMEQLTRLRRLNGLSQRALAKESGVSPATIYELENDRRNPNPSTLRKLARALGVEVAELLGEAEHPLAKVPPSQEKLFDNGDLEEERRTKLEETKSCVEYAIGRTEYWEKKEYRTVDDAYNLAVFAVEEFSSFFGWLFDHGPARPLWEAMERGVGLEIEDEYDALIDTLIERTTRTRRMLFTNAEELAETKAQENEIAAKLQQKDKELKNSHTEVVRRSGRSA
jgi:transcriptional regulator with XRE-family HTH domain